MTLFTDISMLLLLWRFISVFKLWNYANQNYHAKDRAEYTRVLLKCMMSEKV